MANLREMVSQYELQGYALEYAEARVCQDIVLKSISSGSLNRNVTIKGGVVMRSITGNIRRATQDLDLDFIRYSLDDEAIREFINKLNSIEGIKIEIKGKIKKLEHQDYDGKRIFLEISDNQGYSLESKLDLGVHKNMQIEQEEYCFDVCMDDEGASLLMNSREQIFTEKLKSLLRIGIFTTRFKDISDLCYLTENMELDKLRKCIAIYILDDESMRENSMEQIVQRVQTVIYSRRFKNAYESEEGANWLGWDTDREFSTIVSFLKNL